MNRRNFLKSIGKICAVLPFVGSSSAVAKTGASKGKPKAPMCATEVMERYNEFQWLPLVRQKLPLKELQVAKFQKFSAGDRVHITSDFPEYMSHFRGRGKNATVLYSYRDKFGGAERIPDYALDIDGFGFTAWYPENLLTSEDFCIYYDFTEKIKITYKIDGNAIEIIKYEKFTENPFCSFGETQEKIDSGEITYLIQKKTR